ncbi:MAG TPA: chromosome segregation protein SMC [Gemmatales bacterium]|nr:chromosome segregation protein SMC [Gemmatales bacterium]
MLKQLELIGFKSFAERTVFEFGPGITAVVGPNGSGKSNVVDAVRWIMGEQSAKSLRGGGMTDVIFNGSSTRKSLGMAEVTLTMDNTRRFLSVDSDEVQITRRVYRDGTGEYLINKQISRLKDIKDMFLGSGAGVDAYCIIAQGRVEALLQASSQERRFILEEAAGISRFRTKKLETLRKLEQVEQNLQRVRDIQEELARQLQSVRLQAAKAEKFRDYNNGLKKLRVDLALQEWHHDTLKWQTASTELTTLKQTLDQHSWKASAQEQQLSGLESQLAQAEELTRRTESTLSELREKLATLDGTIRHETTTIGSLEQTLTQLTERKLHLNQQETRLNEMLVSLQLQLDEAVKNRLECKKLTESAEAQQAETVKQLADIRKRMQQSKETLYDRLQTAARSHNDQVSLKSQSDSLRQHRRRLGEKHSQTKETLTELDIELKSLEATEQDSASRMWTWRSTLAAIREEKEQCTLHLESKTAQWTSIRERRSGLDSRIQVLDHLERSREGLGAGVRMVLELAGQEEPGPWSTIIGMVADLIMVDREHATLVDAVLGDRVQAFVVRDDAAMQTALLSLGEALTGRMTYLPLNALKTGDHSTVPGLESLIRYVGTTHPDISGLVEHLLARTWIVESLEQARQWAQHYPGQTWVTPQGELLDAQGLVSMGPDREEHGFLSRKSELREHREQIVQLDEAIIECEQEISSLRSTLARLNAKEEQTEQALQVQAEEAASLRTRLQQKRLQGQDLAEEARISQHEMHTLDEELTRLNYEEAVAQERATLAEQAAQQLQAELQQSESLLSELEQQREKEQEAIMAASAALAKVEQELAVLESKLESVRQEHADKLSDLIGLSQQRTEHADKLLTSRTTLVDAQTAVETAHSDRTRLDEELASSLTQTLQLRQEASLLREKSVTIRQVWQQLVDQIHQREMEAGEIRLKLDNLAARLLEEHEVVLGDAYAGYQPPEQWLDVAATQQEINELRRKISRLGNVSLDALDELHTLETRNKDLHQQQTDLSEAKAALDEIILRINEDSKKLFKETYEAVRVQFQELFRKLFGGGMADIVLENPDDLLESGVDITARPPGKEMRNMSLLSGGEKTLTAVALLLAIFKNKPSPFCILDEVDAALDEANVGRFAAVLREFLHLSQFILITHSKKTMVAADVLYGVTMQEAGVSKRVAMRMEEYEEPAPRLAA